MAKRFVVVALIIAFLLIVTAYLAMKLFIPEEDYRSPGRFGSYSNGGLYTFNPETIFESLEQGDIDIFAPYFGDPDEIELYYDPITWSQADYLRIASTLSQKVWGESSGSENWNVESIYFEQNCKDPMGFNSFHMVYYQDLGMANWKRTYTTRLIDIQPWRGLAYWGGGAIFSSTILSEWEDIDVKDFVISADDALQMAEERGGNETDKSHCTIISVSMYQHDKEKWDVTYFAADFGMYIDANNGEYEVLNK